MSRTGDRPTHPIWHLVSGPADFAEEETVHLTPIPCWQHLEPEELRERVAGLIADLEEQYRLDRVAKGERIAGRQAVLDRHPHERPKALKRGPAPRFHAATREAWLALREGVQLFVEEFRTAVERMRRGVPNPGFPRGSFPPNLPYVPLLAPG
jgi:hypothetical protein